MNKHIAIEIDHRIFVIAKILEEIQEELDLSGGGLNLEEIEKEFRKVSNNVVIRNEGKIGGGPGENRGSGL